LKASFNLPKKPFFLLTESAGGFWPVTGGWGSALARRGGSALKDG
jgi:hypothetical protein